MLYSSSKNWSPEEEQRSLREIRMHLKATKYKRDMLTQLAVLKERKDNKFLADVEEKTTADNNKATKQQRKG